MTTKKTDAKKAKPAIQLFLGDASVVDPLVHAFVDERMGRESQALDLETFRFGERPLSEIEAAMRQVGMFSRDRCIWLRSYVEPKRKAPADEEGREPDEEEEETDAGELLALLESGVPEGTTLVISAATLDARGKLWKWLGANAAITDRRLQVEKKGNLSEAGLRNAIDSRLAELGVERVGAGVVDEILKRSGSVLGETLQEIDRLVLAQADPTKLDVAAVRSGMRDLALGWVFDFTGAIEKRDLATAERLIARLLAEGEAPLRLSYLLASFFGELVTARALIERLPASALRMRGAEFLKGPGSSLPPPFNRWPGYFRLQAALGFAPGEIERLHREVLQLDLALKSSPAAPLLLFSRLLQSVCLPAH